jgi:hypothetical protein
MLNFCSKIFEKKKTASVLSNEVHIFRVFERGRSSTQTVIKATFVKFTVEFPIHLTILFFTLLVGKTAPYMYFKIEDTVLFFL